jgi:hypothetical protein
VTNTLHRFGAREDLHDDYIVFAMCTRGKNDLGAVERLRRFLSICVKHQPVNIGDAKKGGLLRPANDLTPLAHWRRSDGTQAEDVINGVSEPTTVSAVFDNPEALSACLKEVKEADLGLSINIAAVTDAAQDCCRRAGIERHAVEYSFGFIGRSTLLPDANTLPLMTMCGHGMIAATFAQKMIDWVKTGRRSPRECTRYMSRFCVCGIFNPVRAERLLCRIANQPHAAQRPLPAE